MIHIAAQCLHFAAKQFHRGVLGQQVIVFVGAVQKQQGVGAVSYTHLDVYKRQL